MSVATTCNFPSTTMIFDHGPDPITQKLRGTQGARRTQGASAASSRASSGPSKSTPRKARPTKDGAVTERFYMPNGYTPSPHEVIVGRGRRVVNHPANKLLRKLVLQELDAYTQADKKEEKSEVLTGINDAIRAHTQVGFGFVKFETATERWFAVEEIVARSTIAQVFRDTLSGQYRSSRQFKNHIRRQREYRQEQSSPSASSSLAPLVSEDGDDCGESRCSGTSSSSSCSSSISRTNSKKCEFELFLNYHDLAKHTAASRNQHVDWWQQDCQAAPLLPSEMLSRAQTEVQHSLPQEDSQVFDALYEAFATAQSFSLDSLEPTPILDDIYLVKSL